MKTIHYTYGIECPREEKMIKQLTCHSCPYRQFISMKKHLVECGYEELKEFMTDE